MRRGRPVKAGLNVVVYVHSPHGGLPHYGVVVAYRTDRKWGRYLIVETDWRGAGPRGPAKWRDSTQFTATTRTSIKPGRIYRKNLHVLDRDCDCQCCEHTNGYEDEQS